MIIKALSVKYPFAGLIMSGEKSIETRTWKTYYRGDLLICCTKEPKTVNSGKAICIVSLIDVKRMESEADWADAKTDPYPFAFGWHIVNIRKIKPFKVKGQLRLFDVNHKIEVIS